MSSTIFHSFTHRYVSSIERVMINYKKKKNIVTDNKKKTNKKKNDRRKSKVHSRESKRIFDSDYAIIFFIALPSFGIFAFWILVSYNIKSVLRLIKTGEGK